MTPSEFLQIKAKLLEIAFRITGYNSYNDAIKKYNDLCELLELGDFEKK